MATYAPSPAWELRARALADTRVAAPLGIGLLLALSLALRTVNLGAGLWIDEGLSAGIADRPLADIPGVLRRDGSPPLYYMLLHVWIGVAGRSEEGLHTLSVLFALATVPVAFWAGGLLFDRRTAWVAALLAAVNPFLTLYAQEARMYALVILLGLVATTCWARAFCVDPPEDGRSVRRGPALGFAAALAAMLYTHNWALFFGMATGLAFLGLVWRAHGGERRRLLRTGLEGYGGTALLYAPWVPSVLYQAANTGAPWSKAPSLQTLTEVPARLLGIEAEIALLLVGGAGLVAIVGGRAAGRLTSQGRTVVGLLAVGVLTILLAWLSSQLSPAWANRYLSSGLAPFLLLSAAGLAHAGRLGLAGLAIVVLLWVGEAPPAEKSNARAVSREIEPSLRPGDLVVVTQPEQVSVLHYYLPAGLHYATLTGPVPDVGVTDWRDGVDRLRAASPERELAPLLDALPAGRRVVLMQPIFYYIGRWNAPWNEQVREQSRAWEQHLSNDPRFGVTLEAPAEPYPSRPNPVRATVFLKR